MATKTVHEEANIFSKISFWWAKRLIGKGRLGKLKESDLQLAQSETSDETFKKFRSFWGEELANEKPSLLRAIRRCFWKDFLIAGIFKLFWGVFIILGAFFFVRQLVAFVQKKGEYAEGYILAIFFFIDCLLFSICLQQMSSRCSIVGIRIRSALMAAIYDKTLRTDNPSSGDVLNMVGNDCTKIFEGCSSMHYLWSGPLEALVIIIVLIWLIGVTAFVGLGLLLLIIPALYFIGHIISKSRKDGIKVTDRRVEIVHEVLLAIKLVKFYAWEQSFSEEVARIRKEELKLLKTSFTGKTISLMIVFAIPPIMALSMFSAYIEITGNDLTAVIAFTTLSLFNTLRFPLVVLPKAIRSMAEAVSGLYRIQEYLLLPEMEGQKRDPEVKVKIEDADIAWGDTKVLEGITFELPPGKIMAVGGPVGSGKSSLIATLLGETTVLKGEVKLGGKIAYVPQTPWIQHGTVRDNILFGKPYDEQKYNAVVDACALERDFEIMLEGDLTEIGERGINLSGGQRQRISLARAAYSDADVYLLDSPLSAVDQLTCNHIFQRCIKGLLAGKTVILITHQLHLLNEFDYVSVIVDKKMPYFGPYTHELMQEYFPKYAHVEGAEKKAGNKTARPVLKQRSDSKTKLTGLKKLEKRGAATYLDWFKEAGYGYCIVSLLIFMSTQIIRIMSDWWISQWTKNTRGQTQEYYITVYGSLVAGFVVFLLLRGFVFYTLAMKAATRLHNKMFSTILKAPLSFFTITPLGNVVNCFSKDQNQVDESLPDSVHMSLIYTMILLTTLTLVCIVLPFYAIVAACLIASFIGIQYYYVNAARFLKMLVATTNSPIFAHFSETLHGMSVIRAFQSEDRFMKENRANVDRNHRAVFNLDHVQLWSSFCLDTIGSLLVFATALFCVGLHEDLDASAAGLAISNSIQKLVFFTMLVRGFADVEAQINSVELISYIFTRNVPQEVEGKQVDLSSDKWPKKGKIRFSNVVMRYFQHMDPALRGVSFKIRHGEKIGVVGRTGSGKSSLLMSIFRLCEAEEGKIVIDGSDVSKLGLTDLRSHLAIIPQEPVLFKGTIRSNLDPFNDHTDHELWRAVELSHLKSSIESFPEKLEYPITENGNNFSLGQKQLFCLARAILKNSKIICLDEATAAMDLETDALIQKTIRKAFADCTIITIAHRLDTIIDYNKILVMDAGKVIEFDTVHNLISNPKSLFASLCYEAGISVESLSKDKISSTPSPSVENDKKSKKKKKDNNATQKDDENKKEKKKKRKSKSTNENDQS